MEANEKKMPRVDYRRGNLKKKFYLNSALTTEYLKNGDLSKIHFNFTNRLTTMDQLYDFTFSTTSLRKFDCIMSKALNVILVKAGDECLNTLYWNSNNKCVYVVEL